MDISYVMPVYNCATDLTVTIESLLDQKIEPYQIIIIDDGSDDDIDFLKEHYTDLVWLTNKERKGAAYCRNMGNKLSTGDIIAVCDAGDFYTRNRSVEIEKFFSVIDNDLFYSDVQVNLPTGQPLFVQKALPWDGTGKPPISHTTVAYRPSVPRYHERSIETDLYEFFLYDCLKTGMNFGYVNKTLCVKMDHSKSCNYRDVKKAKQLKYEMYKEYGVTIKKENV